jgi:hypothetical protein
MFRILSVLSDVLKLLLYIYIYIYIYICKLSENLLKINIYQFTFYGVNFFAKVPRISQKCWPSLFCFDFSSFHYPTKPKLLQVVQVASLLLLQLPNKHAGNLG